MCSPSRRSDVRSAYSMCTALRVLLCVYYKYYNLQYVAVLIMNSAHSRTMSTSTRTSERGAPSVPPPAPFIQAVTRAPKKWMAQSCSALNPGMGRGGRGGDRSGHRNRQAQAATMGVQTSTRWVRERRNWTFGVTTTPTSHRRLWCGGALLKNELAAEGSVAP